MQELCGSVTSAGRLRHTKVVFTLGPATESLETLTELMRAGVDVCRLNMAHGTAEWVREVVARVRQASQITCREIAIMMDVKGPEIRTGAVETPLNLQPGEQVDFSVDPNAPSQDGVRCVSVNYPGIVKDVQVGNTLLVDSGLLRLTVTQVTDERIRCKVDVGGEMGSRRHINLPGVTVNLPALTDRDREHVKLGISCGVDFYALSFVRKPQDIVELRDFLRLHGSVAHIIAKMEDQSAVHNLEQIIRVSDGLMVARGDLGIECPFAELPIIQRQAVTLCRRMGKPVIIATHMLESMIHYPIPTRAEVTDVANAVHELADCVMLSGETTIGKFPVQCVQTANQIARKIEESLPVTFDDTIELPAIKEKMIRSAVILAQQIGGAGIIIFSKNGIRARVLSSLRALHCPVYVFTEEVRVQRQLMLAWGLAPFVINFDPNPELTIRAAFLTLIKNGFITPGDHLVVITNALFGEEIIDTIQVRQAIPLPLSHYAPVTKKS